jgi:hypothetical protein
VPGAEPLRLFIAINETDIDVGGDGVQMDEGHLLTAERVRRIEAELDDGSVVEIKSPWGR